MSRLCPTCGVERGCLSHDPIELEYLRNKVAQREPGFKPFDPHEKSPYTATPPPSPAVAREVDDAMVDRAHAAIRAWQEQYSSAGDIMTHRREMMRSALTAAISPPSPLGGGGES